MGLYSSLGGTIDSLRIEAEVLSHLRAGFGDESVLALYVRIYESAVDGAVFDFRSDI